MGYCMDCGEFDAWEGCSCGPPPSYRYPSKPEDKLITTTEAMESFRLKRDELPKERETQENIYCSSRPIRLFRVGDLEAAATRKYGSLKALEDKLEEDEERRFVRQQRKREREAAAAEGRTPEKKVRSSGGKKKSQPQEAQPSGGKKRQPKEARAAGRASASSSSKAAVCRVTVSEQAKQAIDSVIDLTI